MHQFALRFLVLDLLFVPRPQLEPGKELRFLVGKLLVRHVGAALPLLRALARVLHGQGRGNHQHFAQTTLIAGRHNHPADPRIERHFCQFLPDRGQGVILRDRPQFKQKLIAVADGLRRRRFDKRKIFNLADTQSLHAQNDAGQRRTQDFRIGVRRTQTVFLLVIQTDTHAGRHPPATPGTLIRRSLRNLLDLQLLNLVAIRIALNARQTGIDHITNTRHGQRSFRHIGRQHDAPPVMRLEDA